MPIPDATILPFAPNLPDVKDEPRAFQAGLLNDLDDIHRATATLAEQATDAVSAGDTTSLQEQIAALNTTLNKNSTRLDGLESGAENPKSVFTAGFINDGNVTRYPIMHDTIPMTVALGYPLPRAGSLTGVGVAFTELSGNAGTMDVVVQTVDTSGTPTATWTETLTVTASTRNNYVALATPNTYSFAAGDILTVALADNGYPGGVLTSGLLTVEVTY